MLYSVIIAALGFVVLADIALAQSAPTPPPAQSPAQPAPQPSQAPQPAPGPALPSYVLEPAAPMIPHPAGGRWPDVTGLKPYSPETNGMSLSGFLRYLTFQQIGKWVSIDDAERVVKQQLSQ